MPAVQSVELTFVESFPEMITPCRVIREITESDRDFYFKDRPLDAELKEEIRQRSLTENL